MQISDKSVTHVKAIPRWSLAASRASKGTSAHLQQLPCIIHILEKKEDQREQVDDNHAVDDAPHSRVWPHHACAGPLHERVAWHAQSSKLGRGSFAEPAVSRIMVKQLRTSGST